MKPGRVVFSRMDEVLFGQPAAAAVAEKVKRLRSPTFGRYSTAACRG